MEGIASDTIVGVQNCLEEEEKSSNEGDEDDLFNSDSEDGSDEFDSEDDEATFLSIQNNSEIERGSVVAIGEKLQCIPNEVVHRFVSSDFGKAASDGHRGWNGMQDECSKTKDWQKHASTLDRSWSIGTRHESAAAGVGFGGAGGGTGGAPRVEVASETGHGIHAVLKMRLPGHVGGDAPVGVDDRQLIRLRFASNPDASARTADAFVEAMTAQLRGTLYEKTHLSGDVRDMVVGMEIHRGSFLSNPTFVYVSGSRSSNANSKWETHLRNLLECEAAQTDVRKREAIARALAGVENARGLPNCLRLGVGAKLYTSAHTGESWLVPSLQEGKQSQLAGNCVDVATRELDSCLECVSEAVSRFETGPRLQGAIVAGASTLPLLVAVQAAEWAAERLLVLANVVARYMVSSKANLNSGKATHETRFDRSSAQHEANKNKTGPLRWLQMPDSDGVEELQGGAPGLCCVDSIGFSRLGPASVEGGNGGFGKSMAAKCYLRKLSSVDDWNPDIRKPSVRSRASANMAFAVRTDCLSLHHSGNRFRETLGTYARVSIETPSQLDPLKRGQVALFAALRDCKRDVTEFALPLAEHARDIASKAERLKGTIVSLVFDPMCAARTPHEVQCAPAAESKFPEQFLPWLSLDGNEGDAPHLGDCMEHHLAIGAIELAAVRKIFSAQEGVSSALTSVLSRVASASLAYLQPTAPTPSVRLAVGASASRTLEMLCHARVIGGGKRASTSVRMSDVANRAFCLVAAQGDYRSGEHGDGAFAYLGKSWLRMDPQRQPLSEFMVETARWLAVQAVAHQYTWVKETAHAAVARVARRVNAERIYSASELIENFKAGFGKEPEVYAVSPRDDARAQMVLDCRLRAVVSKLAAESSTGVCDKATRARALASYEELRNLAAGQSLRVLLQIEGLLLEKAPPEGRRLSHRKAKLLRMHRTLEETVERAASTAEDSFLLEALCRLGLLLLIGCDHQVQKTKKIAHRVDYSRRATSADAEHRKFRKRILDHDHHTGNYGSQIATADRAYAESLLDARSCCARLNSRQGGQQKASASWTAPDWVFTSMGAHTLEYCQHGRDRCFFDAVENRMVNQHVAEEVRELCRIVSAHFGVPPQNPVAERGAQDVLRSSVAQNIEENFRNKHAERKQGLTLELVAKQQRLRNASRLGNEAAPEMIAAISNIEAQLAAMNREAATRIQNRWVARQNLISRSMRSPRSISDFTDLTELSSRALAAPYQRLAIALAACIGDGGVSTDGNLPRVVCRPVIFVRTRAAGLLARSMDGLGDQKLPVQDYVEGAAGCGSALVAISQIANVPVLRWLDFRTMLMTNPAAFAQLGSEIRKFDHDMQRVVRMRAALFLATADMQDHHDAPPPAVVAEDLRYGLDGDTLSNALQMSAVDRAEFVANSELQTLDPVGRMKAAAPQLLAVSMSPRISANGLQKLAADAAPAAGPAPPGPLAGVADGLYMEPAEGHALWGRAYAPPLLSRRCANSHVERASKVAQCHPWNYN